MADSIEDRYGDILEDILGGKTLDECKAAGLTEEKLIHLYHNEFSRSREDFREAVQELVEDEKLEQRRNEIEKQIGNLRQQINELENLKHGLTTDKLKEYNPQR